MQRITSITPTLCALMEVELPELSTDEVIPAVVETKRSIIGDPPVEKCFIYAPDAIGEAIYRDYSTEFEAVTRLAPMQVVLNSVMPTVTPVCFASMFTGAPPEAHGISKYEKPVLGCDTLFDALLREGKRVAIVAVRESSISLIFRNRAMSYFIEEYDGQVNDRLLQLFQDGGHDLVLAYNQEYDDTMHRTTPRSPEALRAMRNHLESFEHLAEAFLNLYEGSNRLVVFSPDHGAHTNPETGRGAHGLDIPEDMEVRSFWGLYGMSIQHAQSK